uniref:Uncharacterized protein n=1 Tax=Arundo donax TaxID=35708 RepID=A0A0A8YDU9_ARUDO
MSFEFSIVYIDISSNRPCLFSFFSDAKIGKQQILSLLEHHDV